MELVGPQGNERELLQWCLVRLAYSIRRGRGRHQSPAFLLLRRQEGGDEVRDSQPDSKRASMLSKIGKAVGKTYNLFQVLFHMLKNHTAKIKGSVSLMLNI